MPELPEVETVRRGLLQWIHHKTIKEIKVYYPRIVENDSEITLNDRLKGETIVDITRRGKYLLLHTPHQVLISHLRMEGKFFFRSSITPTKEVPFSYGDTPSHRHVHVAFLFQDDSILFYHDTRKFGRIHCYSKDDFIKMNPLANLGYEPFDELPQDYLFNQFKGRTITIKQALLDQHILLGLGNIYVDETCFEAKISPLTKVSKLTKADCQKIIVSSKIVLNRALHAGGTTIRTFEGSHYADGLFPNTLYVYGLQGTPCRACGTMILKTMIQGRGTHYCPQCQRRK